MNNKNYRRNLLKKLAQPALSLDPKMEDMMEDVNLPSTPANLQQELTTPVELTSIPSNTQSISDNDLELIQNFFLQEVSSAIDEILDEIEAKENPEGIE